MLVCRTCLSRNNLSPIFGELDTVRFNSNQLLLATGIQIKQNDGSPQTACKSCIQTIKDILQFKAICAKTDEILKSIVINFKTENNDRSLYANIVNGSDDENILLKSKNYPACENLEESCNSIHLQIDNQSEMDDDDKTLISFVNKDVKKRKSTRKTFKSKHKNKILASSKQINMDDSPGIKIEDLESTGSESNDNFDNDDFDLSVPHIENAIWLTKENLADTYKINKNEKKPDCQPTQPNAATNSRKEMKERNKKLMALAVRLEGRGQLECKLCHKQTERTSFLSHAKTHFEPEFACEFCGRQFHSRHHMVYHQQRRHGKRKRLACARCAFRAVDRLTLIRHERGAHTHERPFVCAECGDAFRMRQNMVQHMRKHFGVKNNQCDRCPSMFKTLSELWGHQTKVHFMTYTYPCYLCPTTYKGHCAVKRHILNVHGIPLDQQQKVNSVKTKKSEDPPLNSNHTQDYAVFPSYHHL